MANLRPTEGISMEGEERSGMGIVKKRKKGRTGGRRRGGKGGGGRGRGRVRELW